MARISRIAGAGLIAFASVACSNSVKPADARFGDVVPVDGIGGDIPDETSGFWQTRCQGCHGTYDGSSAISTGDRNGDFRLDASLALERHGDTLVTYITDSMPLSTPQTCAGECAEETAAYIRSRALNAFDVSVCETDTVPRLAPRTTKLLTSREYQSSLEDVLGVPADFGAVVANNDGEVGGFTNMADKTAGDTVLDSYVRNAETIAAWAVDNGRPFACTDATACGQRFVDEFLYTLFRGDVPESQRTLYRGLFSTYGTEGLALALEAALTSPFFLYRIEAGVTVDTARQRGYYGGGGGPGGGPTGGSGNYNAVESVSANQFRAAGGSGSLQGGTWEFTENGTVEIPFSGSTDDVVAVGLTARGTDYNNQWPRAIVRVGGTEIGRIHVNNAQATDYRIDAAFSGTAPVVSVEFINDDGVAPYGPGQDINLYIQSAALLESTGPAPTPEPTPEPTEFDVLGAAPAGSYVLTPYELASTMSFMLTGSTPDEALLGAAAADALTTPAQIQSQVERLIDSPRGRAHMGVFVKEWFHLDRVLKANRAGVSEFTPSLRSAMVREVQEHFAHVFYDASVSFGEFYSGEYSFLNDELAQFYGVSGNFGDAFVRTETPGRGGPIASGAFMAGNAHVERTAPILRAVRSREAALCHHVEPPNSPIAGDDIDAQRAEAQARVEALEASGPVSSREFYYQYTDQIAACAVCHETVINPHFGLEDFDNIGRKRESAGPGEVVENLGGEQTTVSIQGTLIGVDSIADPTTLEYTGAKDFSNKIAETEAVRSCFIRKSFRFITGFPLTERDVDTGAQEPFTEEQRTGFACTEVELRETLRDSGDDPRAVVVKLATNNLVRYRQ
ncbi:MAG: DUF1592 domain-containing protein [Myxococcota bacterium]